MPLTADELAAHYREQISDGRLEPGTKLPSLSELQQIHRVGKGAAQAAIGKLRAEGAIESRHGSGNFVKGPAPRVAVTGNWADMVRRRADPDWTAVVLRIDEIDPPPYVREALATAEGDPVVMRQARVYFQGSPAHVEWTFYPVALARGSALAYHDTGEGGVYACLAERGAPVDRLVEHIVARVPLPVEAAALQARAGVPVLEVTRMSWSGDRVVEVGRALLSSDLYEVVHESPFTGG